MTAPTSQSWNDGVRGDQVIPLINADHPCIRVEAGPGTGKTFGLVRRVERILHPEGLNVEPRKVLVVAFNRVIAAQLRADIQQRFSELGIEKLPVIATLHGLCLSILGLHTRMLLDHERDAMIYDLETLRPDLLEIYKDHYDLDQALREHEAGHARHDLLAATAADWLVRHKAEMIADLPGTLLAKMKGGDHENPRFDHIIVDEFQDLTAAEQELVFRLLTPDGAMVALGDPRQSIYHFRGNDREGLSKLGDLTGREVQDFPMTECQRCPATIVTAANTLMVTSKALAMTPGSAIPGNNHVVTWASPVEEAKGMARAIVENFHEHPDERHLVMVPRRSFGYLLRDQIKQLDENTELDLRFSESPLETWPVREAFLIFSLLADPDPATWRAWLAYKSPDKHGNALAPRRNSEAYLKLLDSCGDNIDESVLRTYLEKGQTAGDGSGQSHIRHRISRYFELKDRFPFTDDPERLLAEIFGEQGWSGPSTPLSDAAKLDISALEKLSKELLEAQRLKEGDPKIQLREVCKALRSLIATRDARPSLTDGPCIQVATFWSAKGVTAEHVYVLGLCNETIPGEFRDSYRGTPAEYRQEQQRLFYVSITRSKNTLVLSRPLFILRTDAARLRIAVRPGKEFIARLEISPFLANIIHLLPNAVQGKDWQGCL